MSETRKSFYVGPQFTMTLEGERWKVNCQGETLGHVREIDGKFHDNAGGVHRSLRAAGIAVLKSRGVA